MKSTISMLLKRIGKCLFIVTLNTHTVKTDVSAKRRVFQRYIKWYIEVPMDKPLRQSIPIQRCVMTGDDTNNMRWACGFQNIQGSRNKFSGRNLQF
jgi:hypothetical protein